MLRNTKIWIRLTIALVVILTCFQSGLLLWEYRANKEAAIQQAKSFSNSVHEMTLAGLTGMMITGTIAQRDVFLDQIKHLSLIEDLQVVRGDAVSKVFGPGSSGKDELGEKERVVLQGGADYSEVMSTSGGDYLFSVRSIRAAKEYLGKDCLSCHQVSEGTILGVVSMKISLKEVNDANDLFLKEAGLATLVLGIPFLLFLNFFIRRSIGIPLSVLSGRIDEIASGESDLTKRLKIEGKDEVSEVSASFNRLLENQQKMVVEISKSAQELLLQSDELQKSSSAVSTSARKQSDLADETAMCIGMLAESATVIVGKAVEVSADSHLSSQRSADGEKSVHALDDAIKGVETAVDDITHAVTQFITDSEAISSITTEVSAIAKQTTLLALNAAIEAARAGEQGRGFAVVADEVRKLADKSNDSSTRIAEIAQRLAAGSANVHTRLAAGRTHIHEGYSSVTLVHETIKSAAASASSVEERVGSVEGATSKQLQAAEASSVSILQIATMAQDNAKALEDASFATSRIGELAAGLQQQVSRFKV